jgi:hypothetical protein
LNELIHYILVSETVLKVIYCVFENCKEIFFGFELKNKQLATKSWETNGKIILNYFPKFGCKPIFILNESL